MPKNKAALIRYRVINRCLLEGRHVTKQELKKACERALDIYPIGMRTIDADIHAMRHDEHLGYEAPIKIDSNSAYYYERFDYSIDNIPLKEKELNSILFASKLLEQYNGVEILKTFAGAAQKLVEMTDVYRHNDESTLQKYIDFEKVDTPKGTEHIEPILNALKNKRVLKIEYKSFFSGRNSRHVIHPCLLKEYRNRWYLVGYHDKYEGIRTFGLDRIIALQEEPGIQFIDSGFDAGAYYRNVIGITVLDEKPVEVHLSFSKEQAQYVITQPLHHSQEMVSESDNRIIFKYFLVPNFEFYAQVLGWGEEVEVLKPKKIRNKIVGLAKKIMQQYGF